MLIIGVTLLISNTGGWQFFTSSFLAHDLTRTAYWSKKELPRQKVVVVAIDDGGYQDFFLAQSPLDRKKMTQLLKIISISSPNAKRITLDIDISPVPGQPVGQKLLDTYLLQEPKRWVLPAINSGSYGDISTQKIWREQLCSQGVSFGLPYIPNEFGYPKLMHQYKYALAETTLASDSHCVDPTAIFSQKVMPLSPTVLESGLIIPFNGDLKALAEILSTVQPDWIVVGGAWGSTDIFATPFGDRFGVQVHAAALSGALEQQRVAPHWLQLITAWIFVGFLSVVLTSTSQFFGKWFKPMADQMTGHQFFLQMVYPLLFVSTTFALLYLVAESLSIVHARTGYWLPTAYIASVSVGTVLFSWNLGRTTTVRHENYRVAWQKVVSTPIKQDIHSLATSIKVLVLGPRQDAWGLPEGIDPASRLRALTEGLLSLTSLLVQVLLPLLITLYFALKSV